jgi:hypothetical protein
VLENIENRTGRVAALSGLQVQGDGLPSKQRARRTNDPLAGIDTNTAAGRRTADLVRAYLAALGNPVEVERQAAVIAAAELMVLAEHLRAAALRDAGHADLDQVIRVQGAADRAIRRLGIKAPAERDAGNDLAAYLRDRYGAGDEQPEDDEADAEGDATAGHVAREAELGATPTATSEAANAVAERSADDDGPAA